MKYLQKVKGMMEEIETCTIERIPREWNLRADLLSKLASTKAIANNKSVIQEEVEELSKIEVNSTIVCSME